jgi:hypothetical protein
MSAGSTPLERDPIIDVWNVGQALGKGARLVWQLRRSLKGADVIGLLEAARYTRLLRAALGRWWIVYRAHHPGADHSSDVVVLVHRKRIPRPLIQTIGHAVPWQGPKAGIRHRGRSWPVLDWPALRVVIAHKTPGGPEGGPGLDRPGANLPAWHADLVVLTDALVTDVRKPVALLGDLNAKRGELDELRAIGLRVVYTPTAVDHAAEAGLEDLDAEVMPKAGSDHHRLRWTLRLRRRAA